MHYFLLKTLAWLMIVWGGLFGGVIVYSVIMREDVVETVFGSFFIGGIPLILGVLLLRSVRKNQIKSTTLRLQQQVLMFAKSKNGRISESETAIALNISLLDARILLRELAAKGYADPDVDDRGFILYTFKEFTN